MGVETLDIFWNATGSNQVCFPSKENRLYLLSALCFYLWVELDDDQNVGSASANERNTIVG